MNKSQTWNPSSWQSKPCSQQPNYPQPEVLESTVLQLNQLPPLVTPLEIRQLSEQLAQAATQKRFLLQGGDCAESFAECKVDTVTDKLKILLQMSLILIHGLRKPLIRVGRVAGQYAKPRSQDTETCDGKTLPSYRGDIVNAPEFNQASRTPDPKRLLTGYHHAAMTLNYLRALVDSGFADLRHPEYWDLDFVKHSPLADEYHKIADTIRDGLNFLGAISGTESAHIYRADFFTSHEALLLPYEQALTRQDEDGLWYNLSTHFPWIGVRTAKLDEGHVEYMRGIANPIGLKIGPNMDEAWISELIETLNPNNTPGRLTLIHRLGAEKVGDLLPRIIEIVQKTGIQVLWSCDPMHGNTKSTQDGTKTRYFDDIVSELKQSFAIHQQCNSHLGGVHFEMTGEDVTECVGGARGLTEGDLRHAYKSLVDPRLNYEQALEIAMLIVKEVGCN